MSGLSSYLFSTLSKVGGIGGGSIPDFHYTVGDKVEEYAGQSIWQLHRGQKNDSSKQEASIFVFDKTRGSSYTAVAQNGLKRMRTLRHPGILRYLEGAETSDTIYIATEPVTPLSLESSNDDGLRRWGFYKIAETLKFVNEDCKLIHANLCVASVFVTRAGEWKLGGLELVDAAAAGDGRQVYRHYTSVIPGYSLRMAPEFESQKWDAVERGKLGAVDGWSLACLVYQVFNGELRSSSQMSSQGRIPQTLWPLYQRLLPADLRRRMTPGEFLQAATQPGAFLDSDFVRTSLFLENISVKEEDEKIEFFSGLHSLIAEFPQTFAKYKILPELLKVMEFGGGDAKVLSGIINIGKALDEAEYAELVIPSIVQLFGSNDRALRFSLLEHMDSFIPAVPAAVVGKQVFPNFATGFLDAAPAIREATVKASLAVAPKLANKTLNGDLIRQLVRLVGDPEPGIRTNTLICIGKLCTAKEGVLDLDAGGINESSHRYIICPALLHALRDPFPPVRSAALAVASACAPRWEAVDIARRVIPILAPLLVDGEKPVRVAALRAMQAMIARVEAHSQTMPTTSAAPKTTPTTDLSSAAGSKVPVAAADMAAASMAAASGWGGWAVSSLSSTLSGAISLASSSATSPSVATTAAHQQAMSAPPDIKNPLRIGNPPVVNPTTASSPAAGVPAAAARKLSGVPAAQEAPNSSSGNDATGWGFDDDGWGDGMDDADDAWGNNDDDAWDNGQTTTVAAAPSPPLPPPATTMSNISKISGGMTMANTLTSASFGSTAAPIAKITTKPPNLRMAAPNKPNVSPAASTTTGLPRRKGLGAMKLGGNAKKPAILDEDLF
ncbi:armadillo-type protein [Kickxella alabastrina]|uniref:armadillo-type protein n=1 Tax=Kickxella alabastrina TaxID=61397 RepID=UPI002220D940|nr:armadillo-type protein [Kickxella alabastrina]KAI7834254.1 armadillo-type protein [Kickxella alabastrina]